MLVFAPRSRAYTRLPLRYLVATSVIAAIAVSAVNSRPAQSVGPYLTVSGGRLEYQGQTVNLRGENFNNEPALSYCCGGTSIGQINVNQADYNQIAGLGANQVRFGLDWAWYQSNRAQFFQVLDQHVGWAGQAHLWVIPVMYEPPGGSDGGYGGQSGFWGSSLNKQALINFWADFASHYRDNPTMAGYDIFNEPAPPSEGAYDQWAQSAYAAITAADPNHFVAIEVSSATWDYPSVSGSRILWSGHCYAVISHDGCNYPSSTPQPARLPYWVGEVGSMSSQGTSYVPGNISTWNQQGISWTHFVMHEQGYGLYQNWNAGNFNNPWSAMISAVQAGFQGAVRPGGAPPVEPPPTPAGSLTSGPEVASWAPNRLDVVGLGSDQQVWHRYWDGRRWNGWEPLGGQSTADPSAVSWATGRLDVFEKGLDGGLWHKWWDGYHWNGWEPLGGQFDGGPKAAAWGPNRLDVFVVGSDGQLWHKWWDGLGWNGWEPLGGDLASDPAAVAWGAGRLDVFARGADGGLSHKWWDGQSWNGWEPLGGGLTSAATAASWAPNRLDVFVVGTDGGLWHLWWDGSGWRGFEPQGGVLTANPGAAAWGPNRLDVFGRGTDMQLWHRWWDGDRWNGWEGQPGPPPAT